MTTPCCLKTKVSSNKTSNMTFLFYFLSLPQFTSSLDSCNFLCVQTTFAKAFRTKELKGTLIFSHPYYSFQGSFERCILELYGFVDYQVSLILQPTSALKSINQKTFGKSMPPCAVVWYGDFSF